MKMKLAAVAVLAALTGAATVVALQDAGEAMSLATEQHQMLKKFNGSWTCKISMMGQEMEGKETGQVQLGDLWYVSDFEGSLMGMPFGGHQLLGYDSEKQKYVGAWIDSMNPSMTLMEGTYDAETNSLTMLAEGLNPMTGEMAMERHVTKFNDDGTHTFTMYSGDIEMMSIQYTPAKD